MNYFTPFPIYLLLQNIAQASQDIMDGGVLFSILFYPLFYAIIFIVIRFDIYRFSIFILGYFLTFMVIDLSAKTIFYEFILTIPRKNIFLYVLDAIICFFFAFLCFRDAFFPKAVRKVDGINSLSLQVFFYGVFIGLMNLSNIIYTAEFMDSYYKSLSPEEYWEDIIRSIYWQLSLLFIQSLIAIVICFITKIIPNKWRIKSSCFLLGILFIVYYVYTLIAYN